MSEFISYRDYWIFEREVRARSRFVREPDVERFLSTVALTAKKRVVGMEAGQILWRAQLGHDWQPLVENGEEIDKVPGPHSPSRMTPLKDRASEGRANPKGIPYLYLSDKKETAMGEMRPWMGAHISVAQFKMLKPLKIVDCTKGDGYRLYFEEPDAEKRETAVWADIDRAFSRPVESDDTVADYVPTQILAELFKSNGYDGLVFRSSLGYGHNITLFDLDVAELINCHLFEVRSVEYNFGQAGNSYFMGVHYDEKRKESSSDSSGQPINN